MGMTCVFNAFPREKYGSMVKMLFLCLNYASDANHSMFVNKPDT